MKRDFLKDLGLEKDVIDKIMDENGADVIAHQKAMDDQKQTFKGELKVASETIVEMQNTVKEFKGVDLADLRKTIADGETKYTTDMAQIKRDNALHLALVNGKAKNPKAVMGVATAGVHQTGW